MTGYRPLRLGDFGHDTATLAKVATLPGAEAETVANVATVAVSQPENSASNTPSVANVASVAVSREKTAILTTGPEGWREAILGLSPDHDPCPGFRPGAWARVWANALDFIDRHGAAAHSLGWTAEELFGVHPVVGVIRVDHCGALMLSNAGRILAVETNLIRYANGLTFRRAGVASLSVPIWRFG